MKIYLTCTEKFISTSPSINAITLTHTATPKYTPIYGARFCQPWGGNDIIIKYFDGNKKEDWDKIEPGKGYEFTVKFTGG